ncbi:MAG: hypothetical protein AAF228_10025 [Pseudomonadota bacterium]
MHFVLMVYVTSIFLIIGHLVLERGGSAKSSEFQASGALVNKIKAHTARANIIYQCNKKNNGKCSSSFYVFADYKNSTFPYYQDKKLSPLYMIGSIKENMPDIMLPPPKLST